MSKIYKTTDVSSLPAVGEQDVLYLLQVEDAREAYIWNGNSFIPICPQEEERPREWISFGAVSPQDESWSILNMDIADIIDIASEFLAVVTVSGSNSSILNIPVFIPNVRITAATADTQNYIAGYYYDASYNGSVMVRFDMTNKRLRLFKSWSKITGATSEPQIKQMEVFFKMK